MLEPPARHGVDPWLSARARPVTHYARYLRAVADKIDFVGAHWFQYIDEPLTGRTLDGENAHIGFVTVADLPYVDLAAAARDANLSVLRELQRITSRGTSE